MSFAFASDPGSTGASLALLFALGASGSNGISSSSTFGVTGFGTGEDWDHELQMYYRKRYD